MPRDYITDRRAFLKRSGAATSAAILSGLAGCAGGGGGGGGGTPTATPTATGTPGEAQKLSRQELMDKYGLQEYDYDLEDSLNVFQWTAYWPSGTVEIFEKVYDVDVKVSNYTSNEEMFNKLKAGGTDQFDLLFPSDYMLNILAEQGMIRKLDLEKIPNFENIESYWRDNAPYDPDPGRYSVPYFWGTSGVAWNAEMFSEEVRSELPFRSWDALWDDRFKGQMTMLDDMRETIGAALKRLGYSLNSRSESEINEAKEVLIQQKPLLQGYNSTSFAERLINEQTSPMHSWSGGPFSAYWQLYEDGSSPVGYQVPQEGGVVWVDTSTVTKDAKHPKAAHAFTNYLHNAKIHARIANWVYYPSPNAAAKEHIYDSMLENDRIYPPEETFQKLEFIKNVGDATQLWSEAWTEIKSA